MTEPSSNLISTNGPPFRGGEARCAGRWPWLSTLWGEALLFLVTVLGLLFLFFAMAAHVLKGGSFPWDVPVLQTIHSQATPTRDAVMVFITHRGGGWEVGFAATVMVVVLTGSRRFHDAVFLAVAVGGVGLANVLAKIAFQRVRPHLWESPAPEFDYGFPSGHAMLSLALALAVVVLTGRTRWRWPAVTVGVGFVLAVGFSRIYLGVHFPSDVLSAWLLAGAWVAAVAFVRSGQAAKRLLPTPLRQGVAYGLLLVLLPAAYVVRLLYQDNFHAISPGKVFRSGQMDSANLRRVVERYRIETIINLHGSSPQEEWYRQKTNIARHLNARHLDFALSAGSEVSDAEIEAILDSIRTAPKPMLIHCNGGADRTSLIASLYLFAVEGMPAAQASRELSPFYGPIPHLHWNYSIAVDRSYWCYVSNQAASRNRGFHPSRNRHEKRA